MKAVSSKYIIQRAIDDIGHPVEVLVKNGTERIANWIYDAMRIIGNFPMLEDKVKEYNVKEYVALLPCDYIQEIVVLDKENNPLMHYNKPFDKTYENNPVVLRYRNEGDKLVFNTKETYAILHYKGIQFDDDGYVIIADDEFDSNVRAIVQYIAYMITKINARKNNKESIQMLQYETQEWHRLCANARANSFFPKTLAEHEQLGRLQRAFVLNYNDYNTRFSNISNDKNKYL